jgi:hypothetical protein
MTLIDFSIPTGLTDTTFLNISANGALANGAVLRYANFLNTLAFRPVLNIGFAAGTLIGAFQG